MLYPLDELRAYVDAAWMAPGWQSLRTKQARLMEVRHNQHKISLPEDLEKRADASAYIGYAGEKVDRAKAILSDPEGPQWTCGMIGMARGAEAKRQQMEAWVSGGWSLIAQAAEGRLESAIREDQLVCGFGLLRMTPAPSVWEQLLDFEPGAENLDPEDIDDLLSRAGFTPYSVDPRSMGGEDPVKEKAKAINEQLDSEDNRRRLIKVRNFPIVAAHVPASSAILRWDARGLAEVVEVREMPIRRILDDYRDDKGKPMAVELARAAGSRHLTEDDTATVILRSDRTHMQVFVTTGLPGTLPAQQQRWTNNGAVTDEFIFNGEHQLGRVPYVYFPGRESASLDPVLRWHPLIDDPVARESVALDTLNVQLLSVVRHAAWSGLVVQKDKDVQPPGTGERPKALVIKEGSVSTGLAPGEQIARVPWVDPAAMDLLKYAIGDLRDTIDRHTFGASVYGTHGAGSGYELAQLQAAAESVLAPFHGGYESGLADAGDLMLQCGRFLLSSGVDSVPVRVLDENTGLSAYYELDDRLAAIDWEFKATVIPQPVGGQYAKFQTVDQMVKAGYITQAEGQRRLGIRNGDTMRRASLVEQITYHPSNIQKLSEAALAATFQVLSNPNAPDIPVGQIALPAALAQTLSQNGVGGDAELTARMPALPPPGTGTGAPAPGMPTPPGPPPLAGAPGLPNMLMETGAGAPPHAPLDQVAGLGLPSAPSLPGMAATTPGGMGRMDYTLSQPRP